jgi:hypothetical protein
MVNALCAPRGTRAARCGAPITTEPDHNDLEGRPSWLAPHEPRSLREGTRPVLWRGFAVLTAVVRSPSP